MPKHIRLQLLTILYFIFGARELRFAPANAPPIISKMSAIFQRYMGKEKRKICSRLREMCKLIAFPKDAPDKRE